MVQKAKEHNRLAQQQLYHLLAPKMLSVCRMYIKDLHFAEDVMLKGFFKVFTKINQYKNKGSFEAWVRRIMVFEAIDFLRAKKELILTDEIEKHQDKLELQTDRISENADEIQSLIDDLPSGYKVVFVMYAIEGFKHQAIAKTLGISESTSKSQLHKARKLLQAKLQAKNEKSHG